MKSGIKKLRYYRDCIKSIPQIMIIIKIACDKISNAVHFTLNQFKCHFQYTLSLLNSVNNINLILKTRPKVVNGMSHKTRKITICPKIA